MRAFFQNPTVLYSVSFGSFPTYTYFLPFCLSVSFTNRFSSLLFRGKGPLTGFLCASGAPLWQAMPCRAIDCIPFRTRKSHIRMIKVADPAFHGSVHDGIYAMFVQSAHPHTAECYCRHMVISDPDGFHNPSSFHSQKIPCFTGSVFKIFPACPDKFPYGSLDIQYNAWYNSTYKFIIRSSEDSTPQCRGIVSVCLQAACQIRCRVRSDYCTHAISGPFCFTEEIKLCAYS